MLSIHLRDCAAHTSFLLVALCSKWVAAGAITQRGDRTIFHRPYRNLVALSVATTGNNSDKVHVPKGSGNLPLYQGIQHCCHGLPATTTRICGSIRPPLPCTPSRPATTTKCSGWPTQAFPERRPHPLGRLRGEEICDQSIDGFGEFPARETAAIRDCGLPGIRQEPFQVIGGGDEVGHIVLAIVEQHRAL